MNTVTNVPAWSPAESEYTTHTENAIVYDIYISYNCTICACEHGVYVWNYQNCSANGSGLSIFPTPSAVVPVCSQAAVTMHMHVHVQCHAAVMYSLCCMLDAEI